MQATTEKYGIPPLSPEAPYPSLNFDLAKLCVEGFYPIDFGTAAVAIVPPLVSKAKALSLICNANIRESAFL